jgi:hypothetical protein
MKLDELLSTTVSSTIFFFEITRYFPPPVGYIPKRIGNNAIFAFVLIPA